VQLTRSLRKHDVFTKITEQVRFAQRRFGRYELIDFLAVLFGYAVSSQRTLEEFYKHLQPFATVFMALFERDQLPSRSALSRFLAALPEAPVNALRTLFLENLLARPLTSDKQMGGLVDRTGCTWMVFDIDGTREAARQRALPHQVQQRPESQLVQRAGPGPLVLSLSLGAGMLAGNLAMGMECPPGVGASPSPRSSAHHRVCSPSI
jgi:hypothetical protein